MGWPARSAMETPVVSSPVPAREVKQPSESVVQSSAGIRSRREMSDERDGQRPGNFSGQKSSRKSCIGLIVCLEKVRGKWAGGRLGSRGSLQRGGAENAEEDAEKTCRLVR
jgi:hypothetical protein